MDRKCIKCNNDMKKAYISAESNPVTVQVINNKFFAKFSDVNAYVCPKCGHIELVAVKPEIFDK